MKRLYFLSLSFILSFIFSFSLSSKETLRYEISYKWGLIHKTAGDAVYTINDKGNYYELTLTGKTRSWADKIFSVRDTLTGRISKNNKPQIYIKSAHEKGKYSKDVINYKYSGNTVQGEALRIKEKDGKLQKETKMLTATGEVFDMVSIFYYIRQLDFEKLCKGSTVTVNMFSGSKVESLTIRCVGKEKYKLKNKTEADTYHLKLKFTTGGKKKSSDDIDAWISVAAPHIPYMITGNLPVGQVRATYVN